MGRLVQAAQLERVPLRGRGVLESTGASTAVVAVGGDKYQDRVAKYIPGEVLAAYMSLDRMVVPDAAKFADNAKAFAESKFAVVPEAAAHGAGWFANKDSWIALYHSMPIGVLLVGLIFTPLYIRQLAIKEGASSAWVTQAVMSTLAFLVWAYAIQGGAFTTVASNLYNGTAASVMLIVFTLASGLFGPPPANPDAQR